MADLTDSVTPSTTTATPPYTRPLPDSWSRKKSQFSTIIDALPKKKHRTGVQCKSRKDYIKKIHEVKKGPGTSTSSNRRTLKPSWLFPEYMDALMANRGSAQLLKLMLAMQQVVNDVPYPTSSFYRKEQATIVNEVTTPGTSKQQTTASPVSSTLPSPSRLGYGFSSLPLPARARARIDSCSEEARLSSWSQEATFTLIEAWGRRYMELNRGNLRQKDWQHVADAVNALHNKSENVKTQYFGANLYKEERSCSLIEKKHRTRFQCRFRMESIKKRYKIEKARITSPNRTLKSSWPFFERMNAWMTVGEQADLQNLMKGLSIAPAQQVATASTPASQSGEDYGYSSLSLA